METATIDQQTEADVLKQPSSDPKQSRGCSHYSRGCSLICPVCNEAFICRKCHDQVWENKEQNPHTIDRHAVTQVKCLTCHAIQPSAAACSHCHTKFGEYVCLKCNLFDDDTSKKQFHCEGCGICRQGGRENFFHCDGCGGCFSMEMKDNHKCLSDALKRPCPLCLEDMFNDTEPSVRLACGHTYHGRCHKLLIKRGRYKCIYCNQ